MKEKNVKKDKTKIKKNNDNKKSIKLDKKKFLICFVSLLILVLVVFILIFAIQKNNKNKSNKEKWIGINYDEKIDLFGFSKIYEECGDEITKIEALKINFLISKNSTSIEDSFDKNYKYTDEDFISKNYIYSNKLKNVISETNKDEKITVADELYALYLIEKGRYKDVNDSNKITLENINDYEEGKKVAIQTMYDNGIIEKEDFEQVLTKEKSKEIMVKYVYTYKTMCRNLDYEFLKDETNVTSLYKLPFYPNSNQDAYNIEIKKAEISDYKEPTEIISETFSKYNSINKATKEFLNIVLNINYEDFEKEDFNIDEYYEKINKFSLFSKSKIEEYVEYVKQNKIKIEGSGYAIIPVVYYSFGSYYVRAYIDFKISNSNINNNVLMQDIKFINAESNEFEKGKEYKGYIDLRVILQEDCLIFY